MALWRFRRREGEAWNFSYYERRHDEKSKKGKRTTVTRAWGTVRNQSVQGALLCSSRCRSSLSFAKGTIAFSRIAEFIPGRGKSELRFGFSVRCARVVVVTDVSAR